MANNVINIRNFVDVTTGVASTPVDTSREWGAILFVQKGEDGAATKITRYENLKEVQDGAGSNSEAALAAQQFYGTSYAGVSPTSAFYVAIIGAEDTGQFTNNFTPLMASESYYHVILDRNFTDDIRMAAVTVNSSSQTIAEHKLYLDDYNVEAVNQTLENDTTSITAKTFAQSATHVFVVWSNSAEKKYYSAAAAAFFATRQFAATSRRMAPITHKPAQGLAPVNFADPSVTVLESAAWKNLTDKNGNAYINVKFVGMTAWENGTTPDGDELSDLISADYLNYQITMAVWNVLQTQPRLPMNNDGAYILRQAIEGAYSDLEAAGVITTGVSLDGEIFNGRPYTLYIPIPTGVAKANGLWQGIRTSALLAGSTRKVTITNDLKK